MKPCTINITHTFKPVTNSSANNATVFNVCLISIVDKCVLKNYIKLLTENKKKIIINEHLAIAFNISV